MRVVTEAMPVASTAAVVYANAQADCIMCLLMHKISEAARQEGLAAARQLLQDWLGRALAKYNLHKPQTEPEAVQVRQFACLTNQLPQSCFKSCFLIHFTAVPSHSQSVD